MYVSEATVPFKQYALHELGMRPKSCKSIMASVRMLSDWAETEDISMLDHGTVKAFLYWGKEQRLWAPRTFRNHRQYLKSFFTWCLEQQLISSNPVEGIKRPKLPQHTPRGISQDNLHAILNRVRWYPWKYGFEATRNETILHVLALTGMRLQELLNLENSDVDLSCGEIFVRMGKGQKDRVVPIHPRLMPVLRRYNRTRQNNGNHSRHFFTGAKSELQLSPKDVQTVCRKLSRDTGIKFTPHTLRHTFGRLCVEAGWSIYKIKEVMGHTEITTTQRYLSASTENIKQTFGELDLL